MNLNIVYELGVDISIFNFNYSRFLHSVYRVLNEADKFLKWNYFSSL